MAERRKLTRFAVSAPVRLIRGCGDEATSYETLARDLSAAGAYIYLDDSPLGVGEHVKVEIRLPVPGTDDERADAPPVVGSGRIRRVDAAGLGLSFDRRLRFVG